MVCALSRERRTVVEEALVVAVPWVRFDREGVCSVRRTLVMAMDDFNVLQLEGRIDSRILGRSDMRHVAPVVCSIRAVRWENGRVEDESVDARTIYDRVEIADVVGQGSVP